MRRRLSLSRRTFMAGGAWALAGFPSARAAALSPQASAIAALETHIGGRIGVAALDTTSGARLAYRGGERFAMCSTFKWVLAAAVLEKVERKELAFTTPVRFSEADILGHAPVVKAHLQEGTLTVEQLCAAIVEVSDNSAANLLLPLIGDPAGLTQFMRRAGDPVTRLDRNEPALNTNLPNDLRDTTTPDAMIALMQSVLLGRVLMPVSREMVIGWMKNSRTGLARLRAGLPADWRVGDKTGTGESGALNDVAIAWPPGRVPILIAAYFDGSREPADVINAAHADIARIVASTFISIP